MSGERPLLLWLPRRNQDIELRFGLVEPTRPLDSHVRLTMQRHDNNNEIELSFTLHLMRWPRAQSFPAKIEHFQGQLGSCVSILMIVSQPTRRLDG